MALNPGLSVGYHPNADARCELYVNKFPGKRHKSFIRCLLLFQFSCCAYSGVQPWLQVGISGIIEHDCANEWVKYHEHEVVSHAVQCLKR